MVCLLGTVWAAFNYKSGHVSCELWFSAIIVGCARVSAPTQGRVASGRFDFMLIEDPCLAGIIHTYTTVRYRGSSQRYIKRAIIHAKNNFTFTTLH